MTLNVLQDEMIKAMKSGDKFRKDVIADMISDIKTAAINNKCMDNITEDFVDKMLTKYKKTTQEMVDTCPTDRIGTLAQYKNRLEIVNEFAPKLMDDERTIRMLFQKWTMEKMIALTNANRGQIMKIAKEEIGNVANMKVVSKVLSEMINEFAP